MRIETAVVLFNRDLRVHDNPALAAAAKAERTVPLFVLDERLLGSRFAAPNRVAFMLEALRDLDESLRRAGGRLFVRRGDPVREAIAVARECGAARAPRQRRLERLRAAARGAAGAGLRGGADRVHGPPRRDDRGAGSGDAGGRRSLQGLHPLSPGLEEVPLAAAAAAPRRLTVPPRLAAGGCRRSTRC